MLKHGQADSFPVPTIQESSWDVLSAESDGTGLLALASLS